MKQNILDLAGPTAWILCAASLVAAPAFAVDGLVEINQASVNQGGITSGDLPGFPVTISQRGSYRLTSDLTLLSSSNAIDGIVITSDDVTIDLNGFTLRCSEPAIPQSFVCRGLGATGDGIVVRGENVRIHNGTVRDFPRDGIDADDVLAFFTFEHLRIMNNGRNGVTSRGHGQVVDSLLFGNGSYGVEAITNTLSVRRILTRGNGSVGLYVAGASLSIENSHILEGVNGFGNPTGSLIGGCSRIGSTQYCP